MSDKLFKKPVTPDDEMLQLLKDWVAPDVTEVKKQEMSGKTNFMGVPIEEIYRRLEHEEEIEEEVIPQLTAEEIEQIRQDAYDEGFAQGKEEGYSVGHAEGLEQGHQEGLAQGEAQGYQAGLEQGQVDITEKARRWQALLQQLYNPIEKVDEAAEQQLVNLAVMLAESVIRVESETNKDALMQVLHEAIAALPFNTEFAEIHMHPDDIALLKEVYDDAAIDEREWIIKEEPGYQVGDVIIATPNSLIDRTVKQRIKQTIDTFIRAGNLDREISDQTVQLSAKEPEVVPEPIPDITSEPIDDADILAEQSEQQAAVEPEQATDTEVSEQDEPTGEA